MPCMSMVHQLGRGSAVRPSLVVAAKRKGEAVDQAPAPEETVARSTRTPRDQKSTAPEVLERGAPEHPYPGEFQQTLISSFTLGGIGLHTGENAVVRVRPAYANEGRYFVYVPDGTNSDTLPTEELPLVQLEEGGQAPLDTEVEETKLAMFKRYLLAQDDEGFVGTFQQYLHSIDAADLTKAWEAGENVSAQEWAFATPEPIQARQPDDNILAASISNVSLPAAVTITVGDGDSVTVVGVEHILAALEAAGVDNARIEIEGGCEIPALDGSALGWAMEIQFAGVRPAPAADGSDTLVPRLAARPSEPIYVREGDAFVSLMPEDNMRLTAGVDEHQSCKIIGKQWKSWCLFEDLPFRFELAGARKYLPTPTHLQILTEQGFYKGFTEGTLMIGFGDRWYDHTLLRHVHDEAARCEAVTLLGALALNARPGHAGLPFGHIVSYKATPDLMVQFVRELQAKVKEEDWVKVWDVPLSCDFYVLENEEPSGEEGVDEGEDEDVEGVVLGEGLGGQ